MWSKRIVPKVNAHLHKCEEEDMFLQNPVSRQPAASKPAFSENPYRKELAKAQEELAATPVLEKRPRPSHAHLREMTEEEKMKGIP